MGHRPRPRQETGQATGRPCTDQYRADRRTLLTTVATLGVAGLAGCSAISGDSGDDGSGSDGGGNDDLDDARVVDTDEESETQTVDAAVVETIHGRVGPAGNTIDRIVLSVGLAERSDDVDLTRTSIEYVGPSTVEEVVHASVADDGDQTFATEPISAADAGNDVLSTPSDRYEIAIPLGGESNGPLSPLEAGSSAELSLQYGDGGTRVAIVEVPDSLGGRSAGDVVTL